MNIKYKNIKKYSIVIILFILIIIVLIQYQYKQIAMVNDNNFGNIIDRMLILYLYCEGDKEKFKKIKKENYNEDIYRDDIFLFDFEYRFKISIIEKIKLYLLLNFYSPHLHTLEFDCKKHIKKYLDFIINNYIKLNEIKYDNEIKDTICIHFRCSDSPFNRMISYNMVSMDFYKKAINIALTRRNFKKIIILSCNEHKGTKNSINKITNEELEKSKEMCAKYIEEYVRGLNKMNIKIEIRCGNIGQDFYYLKNAGCSIVTAGTFGLYGALSSDNLLILSENIKNNNNRKNIVIIKGDIIYHSMVKDYYDMGEMKKLINSY